MDVHSLAVDKEVTYIYICIYIYIYICKTYIHTMYQFVRRDKSNKNGHRAFKGVRAYLQFYIEFRVFLRLIFLN